MWRFASSQDLSEITSREPVVEQLLARALSIGVGDPRPGDTTPLRLAGGTSSLSLRLAELMTAQQIADYRRILEEATFDINHSPRFLAYPSADNPQRPGAEEVLRKLAILGSSLYRSLYLQADAVKPALNALRTSEDQTIQILRYNTTQTFPQVNRLVAPEAAIDFDLEQVLLPSHWNPERPPILVVLGHMAITDTEGEPRGPRIVLSPGKRWLQDKKVIDFSLTRESWKPPRSLVMLLACSAGATELTTITDFMLAFHNAGAGAVVSTECAVFSGLLSRFAAEITGALLQKAPLGAAITGFRRRLLVEKNPLGFVFNAIGNADLTLSPL